MDLADGNFKKNYARRVEFYRTTYINDSPILLYFLKKREIFKRRVIIDASNYRKIINFAKKIISTEWINIEEKEEEVEATDPPPFSRLFLPSPRFIEEEGGGWWVC